MITLLSSFCPQNRLPNKAPSRGFSLIETMIMLVLVSLSLVLAIPSFTEMVEKRQVTNGAEQLVSFINSAQGLAMRTNEIVTVSYSRSGENNWCVGATSGDAACDCSVTDPAATNYCAVDSQHLVLNNTHTGNTELVHAITGDGSYAFDPVRGLLTDLNDSLVMELRSNSDDFKVNLLVNNTGRVTLCSVDADHSIPGYGLCPETGGDEEESSDPPGDGEPEDPVDIGIGIGNGNIP